MEISTLSNFKNERLVLMYDQFSFGEINYGHQHQYNILLYTSKTRVFHPTCYNNILLSIKLV